MTSPGKTLWQTQVEFRSAKFPPYEGEEEQINPGLWGQRLTKYLAQKLAVRGILAFAAAFALLAPAMGAPEKLDIPKASWEPIFFEAIDSLTQTAGWTPLRRADLPGGALEVRVWIGFGRAPLEGIRLRREGERWSAFYVTKASGTLQSLQLREMMPRSAWKDVWQKVESLGILTMPDSSTLPDEARVKDGTSYVVEISDGARYRNYCYSNPQAQTWEEARKIIAIVRVLENELLGRAKP